MPTYDYVCDACQHTFEQFQSFRAAELTKCPKCGEEKLRRLFGTGAAIIFKGTGFYETDYRSESYKQAEKADSGTSKPTESKPTESKPAESKPSTPPATGGSPPPSSKPAS